MGVAEIGTPGRNRAAWRTVPTATVHNFGSIQPGFTVTFTYRLRPALLLHQVVSDGIPAGTDLVVEFDEWTATKVTTRQPAVLRPRATGIRATTRPAWSSLSPRLAVARASLPTAPSADGGLGRLRLPTTPQANLSSRQGRVTPATSTPTIPVTNTCGGTGIDPPYEIFHGPNTVLVFAGAGAGRERRQR